MTRYDADKEHLNSRWFEEYLRILCFHRWVRTTEGANAEAPAKRRARAAMMRIFKADMRMYYETVLSKLRRQKFNQMNSHCDISSSDEKLKQVEEATRQDPTTR